VADLRASYTLVLQAVQSNHKLVAWHRCRLQNAPVVATAAAMAMAEQQGSLDIDADSIITAQVGVMLCYVMLCYKRTPSMLCCVLSCHPQPLLCLQLPGLVVDLPL
jgi:hypothetical protein